MRLEFSHQGLGALKVDGLQTSSYGVDLFVKVTWGDRSLLERLEHNQCDVGVLFHNLTLWGMN